MYAVWCYNGLDAEFGFDCGPWKIYDNLDKSTARSIAKHLCKVNQFDFMLYWFDYSEHEEV